MIVGVDPHTTCFYRTSNTQSAGDILRPHGAAQTIVGIVCHAHDLVLGLELDHNRYRTEDLLARDAHVVVCAGQKRRLEEAAVRECAFFVALASHKDACTFCTSDIDVGRNFLHLTLVDLRTDLGGRIKRVALDNLGESGFCARDKLVVDAFLHKDARTCAAYLTLVEENAQHKSVNRLIHVAIVEVDVCALAAELKCRRDEFIGRSVCNIVAHSC